jgi:hypothetical protein
MSKVILSVIAGVVLGVAFGTWNVIATRLDPLAEDTVGALLLFYGPMFTLWGIAGFRASRRTGHLLDGVRSATIVAFVTFAVFVVANLMRVNLFLDAIRQRADWQSLLLRFQQSGFESLRTYANYEYLRGAPLKIAVATFIDGMCGLVGSAIGIFRRTQSGQLARE